MRTPDDDSVDASTSAELMAGTYRILRLLGSGGMGDVFEARHERLGMVVALKIIRRERLNDMAAVARFQREAHALAAVNAENVVRVFDSGEVEGAPFFVMERLQGEDLRALLARVGALDVRRALNLCLDVCRGLAALHAVGIVHRDIKPANLFVTRDPLGRDVAKVVDLGVARMEAAEITLEGAVIGTLRYMAPEQLVDSSQADPRVDVYAVACVLYECVTGSAAQRAANVEQLMFDVLNRSPEPARALRGALPAGLDGLLANALSNDPTRRPATVADLARQIEDILTGSTASIAEPSAETNADAPARPRPRSAARSPQTSRSPTWRSAAMSLLIAAAVAWMVGERASDARARHIDSQASTVSSAPWKRQPPAPSTPEVAPQQAPLVSSEATRTVFLPKADSRQPKQQPSLSSRAMKAPEQDFDPRNPYGP